MEPNYDPTPDQERARAIIAYILLGVLVVTTVLMLVTGLILTGDCYASQKCSSAKDAMALMTSAVSLIFTPIVGLVGSVIGFYFGAKSARG